MRKDSIVRFLSVLLDVIPEPERIDMVSLGGNEIDIIWDDHVLYAKLDRYADANVYYLNVYEFVDDGTKLVKVKTGLALLLEALVKERMAK